MARHRPTTTGLALSVLLVVTALALVSGCGVGRGRVVASSSATRTAPKVGATLPVGRSDATVDVGGMTRTYHLYRPSTSSDGGPVALVVMLHGGFGSGAQAESSYGWDDAADRHGFVVAYPDGLFRAWNVGAGCCGRPGQSGVDDVGFVVAMVASIRARIPVDERRVFVTGISNGGMLAYRLACDTSIFAAAGPTAATLLGPCRDPRPISLLHVHGTADRSVPYLGGPGTGVARIDGPAVPDVVERWRRADACKAPTVSVSGPVTTSTAACPDGRSVVLLTVEGAGHQWPGALSRPALQRGLGLDPPSTALDATATLWDFFRRHPASA